MSTLLRGDELGGGKSFLHIFFQISYIDKGYIPFAKFTIESPIVVSLTARHYVSMNYFTQSGDSDKFLFVYKSGKLLDSYGSVI